MLKTRSLSRTFGLFMALMMALTLALPAAATPGAPDTAFGVDGVVTTPFQKGGIVYAPFDRDATYGAGVLQLPDGKYIIGGGTYIWVDETTGWQYQIAVARLNADGSLDTSFQGDGMQNLYLGRYATIEEMALQPDGKIVLAGSMSTDFDGYDMLVVRLNSDGSLDTTFNGVGWNTVDLYDTNSDYNEDWGAALLVLPGTGKILVGGSTRWAGTDTYGFGLASFNSNGSFDETFGPDVDSDGFPDGKIHTTFVGGYQEGIHSLALQSDGKIVAAGTSVTDYDNRDMAVIRVNVDGSFDNSFDGDGKRVIPWSGKSEGNAVEVQTDGNILVAGNAYNGSRYDFAVTRLTSSGATDAAFGSQTFSFTGGSFENAYIYDIVLSTGKILLVGDNGDTGDYFANLAMVRLNLSGTLDTAFGVNGLAMENYGGRAHGALVQADGKIVLGGDMDSHGFLAARFNADGSLDGSFGIEAPNTASYAEAVDALLLPDGRIIAGGYALTIKDDGNFALAAYNADGSLDITFGTNGKASLDITPYDELSGLALQSGNKIIAAGTADTDCMVARFNLDGSLDTAFGSSGTTTTSYDQQCSINDVVTLADGSILTAGMVAPDNGFLTVMRYTADGALDTTFGEAGFATATIGMHSGGNSLAVDADGNIVVVGFSYDLMGGKPAVARFTSSGALDTTFGSGGSTILDYLWAEMWGLAILPDGKILLAGGMYNGSNGDILLARLDSSGVLDPTFGDDGVLLADFGDDESATALAALPDGKILVGGQASRNGQDLAAFARFNSDGTADPLFFNHGLALVDAGESSAWVNALLLQPDGRIIGAGASEDKAYNQFFTVIRLDGVFYPGDLDLSFGDNGITTTRFVIPGTVVNPQGESAVGLGVSGGKYLMAGTTHVDIGTGWDPRFAVTRFNSDGTVDTSFGTNGLSAPNIEWEDEAGGMTLQPDGKILVVGYSSFYDYETPADLTVARFLSDGSLDPDFSGDGWLLTDISGHSDSGKAVAVATDTGKIVVAGASADMTLGESDILVARYDSAGNLDTSFGTGGIVLIDLNTGWGDSAAGVAIQPDGKIVVAGSTADATSQKFAVLRLLDNGSLDPEFGIAGKVITDFGAPSGANALALQPDGKILLAGFVGSSNTIDFAVARYNADGLLDTSFGSGGKVITNAGDGYTEALVSLALQPDGRILAIGNLDGDYGNEIALLRYASDGSLEDLLIAASGYGAQVVVEDDGQIALGGSLNGFLLQRFNSDLSPDQTFGSTASNTLGWAGGHGSALQSDGKIVVAGEEDGFGNHADFAVMRYLPDGSLDPTFGTDGKVTTDLDGGYDYAEAVAIQASGRIVVVGEVEDAETWNAEIGIAVYDQNGALDPSFSGDGILLNNCGDNCYPSAVAIQPDGKIVLVGEIATPATANLAVWRFNADGTPDSTFDGDGTALIDFGLTSYGSDLVLLNDGDILVVGSTSSGDPSYTNSIALARLNSDGSLDSGFGTGGLVVKNFSESHTGRSLQVQKDGKIVVAGTYELPWSEGSKAAPNYYDMYAARFESNGAVDTTFGNAGIAQVDTGPSDWLGSLALQQNGKIVLGGYSDGGADSEDAVLARLNPDGSLDTTFNQDGIVFQNLGGFDRLYDLFLQPDGKIVGIGNTQTGDHNMDVAVLRWIGDNVLINYFMPVILR